MEKWPNFFIVGAPKAGTTSLYEYLKDIPGIFMSSVKEPHYFDFTSVPDDWEPLQPIRQKDEYLNIFKKVKEEKIVGEASPSYLSDPESAKLIHEASPEARILITLRDPVERSFSNYLMFVRGGHWNKSFHYYLENELKNGVNHSKRNINLRRGFYFEDIKKFQNLFGENQIKIIIFEEWIKRAQSTVQEILKFLNINHKIEEFKKEKHNPYFGDRNPLTRKIRTNKIVEKILSRTMSADARISLRDKYFVKKDIKPKINLQDRDKLVKIYQEDVNQLQHYFKRKLPWKNFDLED